MEITGKQCHLKLLKPILTRDSGHTCASNCNLDKNCYWRYLTNTCYSHKTNLPGKKYMPKCAPPSPTPSPVPRITGFERLGCDYEVLQAPSVMEDACYMFPLNRMATYQNESYQSIETNCTGSGKIRLYKDICHGEYVEETSFCLSYFTPTNGVMDFSHYCQEL